MKPSNPVMASVIFAALTIVAVAFVVAGTSAATSAAAAALPPIGAGLLGGALAYFLVEMSAWDRGRRDAR